MPHRQPDITCYLLPATLPDRQWRLNADALTTTRVTLIVSDGSGALAGISAVSPADNLSRQMLFHELTRQQQLPRPLERIFPFFEKPENLGLITPPALGFQLLTPSPVEMKLGQIIDYQIRLSGVPLRWRSLISAYDPPHLFVDKQLIGPYGYWHHLHRFEQKGSHTLIVDRVIYALPVHLPRPMQGAAHRLYVAPALKRIFDYRQRVFAQIFGCDYSQLEVLTPRRSMRPA